MCWDFQDCLRYVGVSKDKNEWLLGLRDTAESLDIIKMMVFRLKPISKSKSSNLVQIEAD